ncbi:MAG TPA: DUF952 domain-containing protein [Polyangiales bacterium]|nr:DUF952 domain-containing protein [Polyangiales bacterium]
MASVFRILSADEWQRAQGDGVFRGAAHDQRDGFIHCSSAVQVAGTLRAHYAGVRDLLLLFVDASALPVRWEPSREGELFPHVYGELPVSAVQRVESLPLGQDGLHQLPELPRTVEFYFDYLSPYSYLASLQIREVCVNARATVIYRPILLPVLLDHWGQLGPAEVPPKAVHTFKECLRYAFARGIPFRAPRLHPFNPLLPLRATLAADNETKRERVVTALFNLGWVRGGDLSAESEVEQQLTAAALPAAELISRARAPEIKDRLRSETDLAIQRGVFGVPSMLVDGELFWGFSQLENLGLYLGGRDPLRGHDYRDYMPKGSGAKRSLVQR